MSHNTKVVVALVLLVGCSPHAPPPTPAVNGLPILVGPITRDQLTAEPYGNWFTPRYEEFAVDTNLIAQLRPATATCDVLIFLGTWCGDTKREVPRVYRIFDALNISEERIRLYALDRNKDSPLGLELDHAILRIPTIIFFADGVELGRIIESPTATLLEDLLAILLP